MLILTAKTFLRGKSNTNKEKNKNKDYIIIKKKFFKVFFRLISVVFPIVSEKTLFLASPYSCSTENSHQPKEFLVL